MLVSVAVSAQTPDAAPAAGRALLNKYCVSCHSDARRTAGLSLESIDPSNADAHAATWEKVVRKLRSGAMPPTGMPRPPRPDALSLAVAVERVIDRAAATHPAPGRPVLHRLNRVEYAN